MSPCSSDQVGRCSHAYTCKLTSCFCTLAITIPRSPRRSQVYRDGHRHPQRRHPHLQPVPGRVPRRPAICYRPGWHCRRLEVCFRQGPGEWHSNVSGIQNYAGLQRSGLALPLWPCCPAWRKTCVWNCSFSPRRVVYDRVWTVLGPTCTVLSHPPPPSPALPCCPAPAPGSVHVLTPPPLPRCPDPAPGGVHGLPCLQEAAHGVRDQGHMVRDGEESFIAVFSYDHA